MRVAGSRSQLMAAGDERWRELCVLLDAAYPLQPLHDPDSPSWNSRDVYAHFWRMHAASANAIRWELEHGERYRWSELDEDEYNARRHAEDQDLSLEEARRLAHESRDDYRALMASLSAEQFERVGRRHADDLVGGHYAGHIGYILSARGVADTDSPD